MTVPQKAAALVGVPGIWHKVYRVGRRKVYVFGMYVIYTDTFSVRAVCGRHDLSISRQRTREEGARKLVAAIRRRLARCQS